MDEGGEGNDQARNLSLLGELAGSIAHDFNNVLTALGFELERARGSELSLEAARALRNMDLLLTRAATTTRQLVSFARRSHRDARALDVNGEVSCTLGVLDRLLGDAVRIVFVPSPGPLWMLADPGMVCQMILNLAFNARDAMPQGGTLTVRAEHYTTNAGTFVRLRFTDTGTGIAPEHLGRVFEPFFTTKGPTRGTGLGLSSVERCVRQHGGWVEVESVVGVGTTFTTFLPSVPAPDLPGVLVPVGSATTQAAVLVVEDDATVRESLVDLLEGVGYRVEVARSGAEALQRLRHQGESLRVILCSAALPGPLSGAGLAQAARALCPHLAIVLMTGGASDVDQPPARVRLLAKPFRFEALLQAIEEALEGARPGAAPAGR